MRDQANFAKIVHKVESVLKSNKIKFYTDESDNSNKFTILFELYLGSEIFESVAEIHINVFKERRLNSDNEGTILVKTMPYKLVLSDKFSNTMLDVRPAVFTGNSTIVDYKSAKLYENINDFEDILNPLLTYIDECQNFIDSYNKFQTNVLKLLK